MEDHYSLIITTPSGTVYHDAGVFNLIAHGSEGELAVLPGHTTFMTPLRISRLTVWRKGRRREKEESQFFLAGGILRVKKGEVSIVTPAAEMPQEIDVGRAARARKRARERLSKSGEEVDLLRAELALARAEVRLRIASSRSD